MSRAKLFSAEIKLIDDQDSGLRVECSEKLAGQLKRTFNTSKFKCGRTTVNIPGSRNIHSWVEFPLTGGDIQKAKAAITIFLTSQKIEHDAKTSRDPGETVIIFTLHDISIFDK